MEQASWVVRGNSGQQYALLADASTVGFDVVDPLLGTTLARRRGVWQVLASTYMCMCICMYAYFHMHVHVVSDPTRPVL